MVIWRGFGFLAFILGGLGLGLGWAISGEGENGLLFGLGLLLGGAATFAAGWYLNVIGPRTKAQAWIGQRGAELQNAVVSGRFQPSPGVVPSSEAEAHAQAGAMLDRESVTVRKRLSNIHTMFWIPMQWWGVVFAALSIPVALI